MIDYDVKDFPFCCALDAVGDFVDEGESWPKQSDPKFDLTNLTTNLRDLKRRGPFVATTIPDQVLVIKALKAVGAKPIQTFKSRDGQRLVTLWFCAKTTQAKRVVKGK